MSNITLNFKPFLTLDDELCNLGSDFALELMSPIDDLAAIQGKLEEYRENGAQLGWSNHPESQQVHIYRSIQPVQVLERPNTLLGEELLPGYTLNLVAIWPQG
jgi:Uma2 family endonuclease